jgi:hypothetical protein
VQAPISASRGPRPWRSPRTAAERLELAAWVQFALVGFVTPWSAFVVISLAGLPGVCMDPGDPGCGPAPDPTAVFYAVVVLAALWCIAVAGLPVLLLRLYRRGRLPLGAAIVALAAPLPVAYALTRILL